MNNIDALLLGLDAEPGTQLTPAETARSERLLAQVTQCAPSALAQYAGARPAAVRRRPPARFALAAAGVAAAALVVGLVAGGQFLGHAADHQTGQAQAPAGLTLTELADWTTVPGHPAVTSPVVRQAAGTCLATFRGGDAFTAISDVDQRGSVITLMATDPASDTTMWCMIASGRAVATMVVNSPSMPLPAIGATAVNALSFGFGIGSGTISEALGETGRDVTGVSFKPATGKTVTATVQDGFWSLWWPPAPPNGPFDGTVTWTTADGASHTAPLAGIYAYSKKPATGNGKPSAIPVRG